MVNTVSLEFPVCACALTVKVIAIICTRNTTLHITECGNYNSFCYVCIMNMDKHKTRPQGVSFLHYDCFSECTSSLKLAARHFDKELYVRLLKVMMKSKETKSSHFKFLLAATPHIEGDGAVYDTKFCCSSVLDKEDIDEETLQAFLNAGAYLVPEDIDKLIDTLPDNTASTAIIKTITDTGSPEQVNSLCKKSLDAKKFKFVAHFISSGAQPEIADIEPCVSNWKDVDEDLFLYVSSKRAQLLHKAIWSNEFGDADRILDSTLPLNTEELDLTSYLKSTSIPVELVRKMLDWGIDPNKGNPLDAIFCLDNNIPKKCQIIRLLVEKGAKVHTSVLFKVTDIALTRNPGT